MEAGWTCSKAPSQCVDVDECAEDQDTCDANATCTNVPGSFECTCNPGYMGQGQVCTNTDDCSPNPCQHSGTCTDGVNGYTCACASGYRGPTCEQATSPTAGIAAGYFHSLAVKIDGTVWAWGKNDRGQLGDGTTTDRTTPVQVVNLAGVVAVAAGDWHNLALKSDGTVWAWGYNNNGELGDGTTTNRSTPGQVANLTGVVAVDGGGTHSLALKGDGTVWAWGQNGGGALGNGTTTGSSTPVPVTGL